MKELVNYISCFGDFNSYQQEVIISKTQIMDLRKDAYFSQAGKVPKQVGFVLEGVLRGCYYTNTGAEVTRCFISEN